MAAVVSTGEVSSHQDQIVPQKSASPPKPTRKRKRLVISCTECHRRKQKCDRAFPCSNCIVRNKQSLCQYENEAERKQQLLEEREGEMRREAAAPNSGAAAQVSALGYQKTHGLHNTSLGIFQRIEDHSDTSSMPSEPVIPGTDQGHIREKYKSLLRQLPSKAYIEELLPTFFREFNFHYSPLDEGTFRDHLREWQNLPFSTLSQGPQSLSGELQYFPALLFQMLALALQFLPMDYDRSLDNLKYAAGMSFDDLSNDYSETAIALLTLLGKRHTNLLTVQTGFLRTAYLKNCGMVPESWHSLSQTIRDAQEIGLHKDVPERHHNSAEDALERLWHEQLRRRVWMILSLWDIHMALVLGRPATIDPRDGKPSLPLDAPVPKNRRTIAPSPRTMTDHPTPLSFLIWAFEVGAPLRDIYNLEKSDPHQNDSTKVAHMHNLINQIEAACPAWLRVENPDTTFDKHPECYWLERARQMVASNSAFVIMALHRPYIFINARSRTEALRAGLKILRAQRNFFDLINSAHYKMFSIVLNTFDAVVLVAAIYILHPYDNSEDLDDTLQHFEWAMERFQMMTERNAMAKSALGVLKAIHIRLKKTLSGVKPEFRPLSVTVDENDTPSSSLNASERTTSASASGATLNETPGSSIPSVRHTSAASTSESPLDISKASLPVQTPQDHSLPTQTSQDHSLPAHISQDSSFQQQEPQEPALPPITYPTFNPAWGNGLLPPPNRNHAPSPSPLQEYSPRAMAPLQPTHDLLFNDLNTFTDLQFLSVAQNGAAGMDLNGLNLNLDYTGLDVPPNTFQFEGDFSESSFWGWLNTYNP